MNIFDQKLKESGHYPLKVDGVSTLVLNMRFQCNMRCMYYYVDALSGRKEEMSLETVENVLNILRKNDDLSMVEITGGSPELNPHFKYFIKSASEMGKKLAVVSDLALYTEHGMKEMPEFLAENSVKILAFLSSYNEETADRQMGTGTYQKVISGLKRLNSLGYGKERSDLKIALVFFPDNPEIPDKDAIANAYAKNLKEGHRVDFNHLIVFNNLPFGRFNQQNYMKILEENFNPDTVKNLPCRHVVSVSPDGGLFDCDFYTALDHPIISESRSVTDFNFAPLNSREIATGPLCLACTAGAGATCAECCI